MKLLRATLTTIGVAFGLCCASVWASPFDDGNKAISASFTPYAQKSAQHSKTDVGLEVDLGSRIGFAAPNEVPNIFGVSRLRGNMPANKEQNSRRLQTIQFGPQWSEKLPLGRVWVGAVGELEVNYRVGLGNAWVPAATVGYRHFQQRALSNTDPPKGKNHLATLRFQLPQKFFVQHDRGNMPLDTYQGKDDTAWRLG